LKAIYFLLAKHAKRYTEMKMIICR